MLLHLDLFKGSCSVCSEEETGIELFKVKTRRHRQYLHDFLDGESDLLANSSVSLEVNYKILKKKQKIEEKIPMWTRGRTIAWDEIEIGRGL